MSKPREACTVIREVSGRYYHDDSFATAATASRSRHYFAVIGRVAHTTASGCHRQVSINMPQSLTEQPQGADANSERQFSMCAAQQVSAITASRVAQPN